MKKLLSKIKIQSIKETLRTTSQLLTLVWKIDWRLFLASLIAILIPGVIPFINIYIYKLMIDEVVRVVAGSPLNPDIFYPLIAARIVTYFFQDAAFRTQELVERLLWAKIPIELNQMLFKKISSLDMHYYENDKFRNQLEKVREAYAYHPQRLVEMTFYTLQSLTQLIIAFVAIITLNWMFVLLILVVAIPDFIIQTRYSKQAWGIWSDQSKDKKRYNYIMRILEGHREHKEVKLFSLAARFLGQLRKIQTSFYHDTVKLSKKKYVESLSFNVLSTAVFIGVELYVIWGALNRRLTIGDINFYTGVVSNFQNGLGGLLRNINGIFDSALYVKTIFDILEVKPIITETENPVILKLSKPPVIEFKDVSFAYPDTSKKILSHFTMTIEPGEKIAFVGENGAGKSTIIKLLTRFYDVTEGEILINGINIKDLKIEDWYTHVGVLFQDFNRYEDEIQENVYLGKVTEEYNLDKIITASKLAGSHEMIEKLDNKYEQMLGRMFEGGIELSGGQWQKVALARAFFRSAPILVLDEPTSAIDAKAESEIFGRVEKLSKDKTVLIISHRFSTVRNADKIYVIDDGRIKESGTHAELMKLNGQYATLFNLQAKGYQ